MKKSKVYVAHYTLPNIFRIGPVRFIPGLNYLSEDDWAAIKDHPLLPYRFKEGHISWVGGKGPEDYVAPSNAKKVDEDEGDAGEGEGDGSASDVAGDVLRTFNTKDSLKLIKETLDLALLQKWKEKEDRKGVINALDEQIAALTALESDEGK